MNLDLIEQISNSAITEAVSIAWYVTQVQKDGVRFICNYTVKTR